MSYATFEAAHLDGIVQLCAAEGWTSFADPATALRACTAPGSIVIVAVDQGVVGFAQLQSDGVVHAHVSNILVAPAHRRRGVERRLLEYAFARSGARYLDLVSTEGTHDFYRAFDHKEFPGFRVYPQPVHPSAAAGAPAATPAIVDVLLETARLVLRRFRLADVESFVAYRSNPEVARYQSWESWSAADATAFIEAQGSRPLFERGTWSQIAVEDKASGALIGDCALRSTARDPRQAELGFTFARPHQGRGLATETVSHLLDYAFQRLHLHRVFAIADDRNRRAIALLERVGMRREGHFREAEWFKGTWASDVLYAVLESERG